MKQSIIAAAVWGIGVLQAPSQAPPESITTIPVVELHKKDFTGDGLVDRLSVVNVGEGKEVWLERASVEGYLPAEVLRIIGAQDALLVGDLDYDGDMDLEIRRPRYNPLPSIATLPYPYGPVRTVYFGTHMRLQLLNDGTGGFLPSHTLVPTPRAMDPDHKSQWT